jgi:UTP--glucose-1-phosphate uridylyltransferase
LTLGDVFANLGSQNDIQKKSNVNTKRAVITAAGRNQHTLPLQTLVDRDGAQKSALRIIVEEALSAGAEDICLVICPGDQNAYRSAIGDFHGKLTFVEQKEPLGYGHALLCAREFVGREPFLHCVSDHLYISRTASRCAQQLIEIAKAEACSVSAVQATRESMLPYYGAVGGKRLSHRGGLYEANLVIEKPTPTEAEQTLIVPGLRAAHYLCFFGMHVLTPGIMDILGEQAESVKRNLQLAPALNALAQRERYLAYELPGRRYNLGVKFGLLNAQLALSLSGHDREEVLAQLVEALAARVEDSSACPQN